MIATYGANTVAKFRRGWINRIRIKRKIVLPVMLFQKIFTESAQL